jgi:hypothetical protein
MSPYPQVHSGDVVEIPRTGKYIRECCSCGATHSLTVAKVTDKSVALRVFGNPTTLRLADAKRKRKPDDDPDDDDRIVEDGESVRITMPMMDALQKSIAQAELQRRAALPVNARDHQPHYVDIQTPAIRDARAQAIAARDARIALASNAWRSSPSPTPVGDAREARRLWIDRATNAWKSPALNLTPVVNSPRIRDAAQPDLGSRPADLQARRDAEYAQRCRDLENAWKSPAMRANEIEAHRKAFTFENGKYPMPGGGR